MDKRKVAAHHIKQNVGWTWPYGEPFSTNPPEHQYWTGIPSKESEPEIYARYETWLRSNRPD